MLASWRVTSKTLGLSKRNGSGFCCRLPPLQSHVNGDQINNNSNHNDGKNKQKKKIVIVGYGWAGLGAAHHLCKQGFDVAILDGGNGFGSPDDVCMRVFSATIGGQLLQGNFSNSLGVQKGFTGMLLVLCFKWVCLLLQSNVVLPKVWEFSPTSPCTPEERISRLLKEEIAGIRAMHANKGAPAASTSANKVLKVMWEKVGEDYIADRLSEIFSEFGVVEDVKIKSSKKKDSAFVVMAIKDAVARLLLQEVFAAVFLFLIPCWLCLCNQL